MCWAEHIEYSSCHMGQVVYENICECANICTFVGMCLITNTPSYKLGHMDMILDFGNLRGKKNTSSLFQFKRYPCS